MKAVPRIKTYSLTRRIVRYMERSWWPIAIIVVMLVIVANFPE